MKAVIHTFCAVGFAVTLFGAPRIDPASVTISQDPLLRSVAITYELEGEPAIVTVDVQTNGVSISGENLSHFAGDVNRVVEAGARRMTWRPDKAWPGQVIPNGVTAVVTAWATNTPPNYMVVGLVGERHVEYYATAESIPGGVTNDLYKTEYLVMRKIPAANVRWRMGSPTWEDGREGWERREVAHYVTLSEDFFIGVYPITQRQYELVTGTRPAAFTENYALRPVECVSYNAIRGSADEGCSWPVDGHAVSGESFLGRLRALSGVAFELPLDAQWEFACRAGTGSALYDGNECTRENVQRLGCCMQGSNAGTTAVGSYVPNAWGLYDMMGNTWEWCLDLFQENPLGYDPEVGPLTGDVRLSRVARGACFFNVDAGFYRSAFRGDEYPDKVVNNFGFRVACPCPVFIAE